MDFIKPALQSFQQLSLSDIESVTLLNRTDHKYCIHRSALPSILELLKSDHSLLKIDGHTIFPYYNTYFDTDNNQMYLTHQNERGNRYKIRIRQYVQTQINFLEIKLKTNKGRTIKQRIERNDINPVFNQQELNFLQNFSPYWGPELKPLIKSKFNRITIVNNDLTERITIDISPSFENQEKEISLENLAIIEVKQSKEYKPARIIEILKKKQISEQSFSKYCIGRSLLEEDIKKNNFKPLLLKISKKFK